MFLTTLMNWVVWAAVAFSILATIVNIKAWRKTRRSCRQILARWQTESPPVGEAEVVLKTGDRIHRQPYLAQVSYVWFLPLPDPSQVEEVLVDNPPQSVVLPVPEGLPRWP